MNGTVKKILSVAVWVLLVLYMVFSFRVCSDGRNAQTVKEIKVRIDGNKSGNLLGEEDIRKSVTAYIPELVTGTVTDPDTRAIEAHLASNPFISSVRCYADLGGTLNIDITERRPVARFLTRDGSDFYVSDDGWILPARGAGPIYLPVVTGSVPLPFEKGYSGPLTEPGPDAEKKTRLDYQFLVNLINFVGLIGNDSFWNALIVQIDVRGGSIAIGNSLWKEPHIDLVTRVGNHVVGLGPLEDTEAKLEKLLVFYRKVLDHEGWDSYGYINLQYRNQVVCTK